MFMTPTYTFTSTSYQSMQPSKAPKLHESSCTASFQLSATARSCSRYYEASYGYELGVNSANHRNPANFHTIRSIRAEVTALRRFITPARVVSAIPPPAVFAPSCGESWRQKLTAAHPYGLRKYKRPTSDICRIEMKQNRQKTYILY